MFRVNPLERKKIQGNGGSPLNIAFHARPELRISDPLNRDIYVGYLGEPLRSQDASPLDDALRGEVFGDMQDNVISLVTCTFPTSLTRRGLFVCSLLVGSACTPNIDTHGDPQHSKADVPTPHLP